MTPTIIGYDHIGIRVSDAAAAVRFYGSLGFQIVEELSNERVAELLTPTGTRINLIFNGEPAPDRRNVLMDEPMKRPGHTHCAFVVDSLEAFLDWASDHEIAITEGPHDWGRRITCFIRDPDGNVLEFNELVSAKKGER